jgi:rubrerythrin
MRSLYMELKQRVKEEEDAIRSYTQLLSIVPSILPELEVDEVMKVIEHIRREEREHKAMLERLIKLYA